MQVAPQPVAGQRDAESPPRLEVGDTARNVSEPRVRIQSLGGLVDVVVDVVLDVVVDGALGSVLVDGDVVLVVPPPDPPPAMVVDGELLPGVGGVLWYVNASTRVISTLVAVRNRTITSTTIGALTAGAVSTSESPDVSARTTAASPNHT